VFVLSTNLRSSSEALCEAAAQLLIGGRVLQDAARRLVEHEGLRPRLGQRDKGSADLFFQIRAAVLPLGVVPRVPVHKAGWPAGGAVALAMLVLDEQLSELNPSP